MGYVEILLTLALATLAFIGLLIWFRTKRNGDYTVFKVAAGVGLTIAAQWVIAGLYGLPVATREALLLWPFAVSGGAIIIWQAVEWGGRQWQRVRRSVQVVERRQRKG